MAGLCFFFEPNDVDVYSGRRIDLDAWNYAAKMAGDVDRIVVVNRTDMELQTPDASVDFRVEETVPYLAGKVARVCCPWDTMPDGCPLWKYDHAADWYVFGPASGWDVPVHNGVCVPQAGNAAPHSAHIATTVMAHRYWVRHGHQLSR